MKTKRTQVLCFLLLFFKNIYLFEFLTNCDLSQETFLSRPYSILSFSNNINRSFWFEFIYWLCKTWLSNDFTGMGNIQILHNIGNYCEHILVVYQVVMEINRETAFPFFSWHYFSCTRMALLQKYYEKIESESWTFCLCLKGISCILVTGYMYNGCFKPLFLMLT